MAENDRPVQDTGIPLTDFLAIVKSGWVIICACSFIAAVTMAVVLYFMPDQYRSQATINPRPTTASNSIQGAMGGLSSLGSLVGLTAGAEGGATPVALALATTQSRAFANHFVSKNQLVVEMFAGKYDPSTGKTIIDQQIYNYEKGEWLRRNAMGIYAAPTPEEIYQRYQKLVWTELDKETGLITASLQWIDPVKAHKWLSLWIADADTYLRESALQEASGNLEFLHKELGKSNFTELTTQVSALYIEHLRQKMMASNQQHFMFDVIDPPNLPEEAVWPRRVLLSALGGIFGLLIGISFVFLRHFYVQHYRPVLSRQDS